MFFCRLDTVGAAKTPETFETASELRKSVILEDDPIAIGIEVNRSQAS
jgi:hypothetical protein